MIKTFKDGNEIKQNSITLSFASELEKDFLQEYFNNSIKHVRMAVNGALYKAQVTGIEGQRAGTWR